MEALLHGSVASMYQCMAIAPTSPGPNLPPFQDPTYLVRHRQPQVAAQQDEILDESLAGAIADVAAHRADAAAAVAAAAAFRRLTRFPFGCAQQRRLRLVRQGMVQHAQDTRARRSPWSERLMRREHKTATAAKLPRRVGTAG
eukprot:358851-Chlamydomonas_euryale.AAC.4